jgi:tetratricopeptide (TPR) repeat protein
MKRGWLTLAAAMLWAAFALAQQEVAPDDAVTSPVIAQARMERAAASIDQGRFRDALADTDAALGYTGLSATQEDWARYLRARALWGVGRGADAETEVRKHYTAKPSAYALRSLVTILALRERWAAAAQAILDLPAGTFAHANAVSVPILDAIVAALSRTEGALRGRLLARLAGEGYVGPHGGKLDDRLRLQFVSQLLAEGKTEDAAKQTRFLETPSVFVALLTDRAYEKLWTAPDVAALTPQEMQLRVRARAAALINRGVRHGAEALEAVRALRASGEPLRAAATAERSVEQILSRPEGRRYARIILIERAYALADLGQAGAAAAAFDAILGQYPDDPISSRLAYARVMEAAGRPAKALTVLEPLDPEGLTPAARAVALQITACAQQALGQPKAVAEARQELAELGLNAAPAALEAALCAGDDEGAKALVLNWLGRADLRRGAVAALQLYAEPQTVLSVLFERRRRLQALIARQDVQAAIAPHGRTIGWSFQRATAVSY